MFQRLDHVAIYLLIAGTYTPFTLAKMPWPEGSTLLAVVWTLAAIGIGFEFIQKSKKRYASVVLYVVMGWMIVLQIGPLLRSIESGGVAMLLLGGVTYTAGLVFYFWDRLPYNHAIWHGFVLGGSGLHFGSVMIFVVPA
jgi:hemolysin III